MKRSRSLSDMVGDVEQSLLELDEVREVVLHLEKQLSEARHEVQMRFESLATVRDALAKEYPEIIGAVAQPVPEASSSTGYEVIEVDDENDPRYTSGRVPPSLGSIEFEERG